MSEVMNVDGGPIGRLLLVLTALHAAGVTEVPDAVYPAGAASGARRGFPIY